MINKMKKFILRNPIYTKEVTKNLNDTSFNQDVERYARERDPELLYTYRILYNIICNDRVQFNLIHEKEKFKPLDILKSASKNIFGMGTGESGFEEYVLYTILQKANINFVVAFSGDEPNVFRLPTKIELTPELWKSSEGHQKLMIDILNSLGKKINGQDIPKDTDIILYINNQVRNFELKDRIIIPRYNEITKKGFIVETCTISYTNINHGFHAISGFICDSNYKIYDEALNITIDYKWVEGIIPTNLSSLFNEDFTSIKFSTVLYVNSKKKYLYLADGQCNF